ncbi:MAG TPA: tetratricopeptide repeat-containing sensor histidine kinase [Bacteroidia bacterium]|nr:tetratricopeptide repeat-containing sensor histidine kinase [Bacteroidia bacterium]
MRKPILFTTLFTILLLHLFAGAGKKLDSLVHALPQRHDTMRVVMLIKISQYYMGVDDDSALFYAKMLKQEAEKWGKPSRIADAYLILGSCYYHLRQDDSAFHYKNLSKEIAEKNDYKKGIANAYSDLGLYLKERGEMDSAVTFMLRSATIREEIGDERNLAVSYTNLGLIFASLDENEKAAYYDRKALAIFKKNRQMSSYALVLNNLASVYDGWKKYDTALAMYHLSYEVRDSLHDTYGMAQSLLNIGVTYRNLGDFAGAEKNLSDALALKTKIADSSGIAQSMLDLAQVYRLEKKSDRSVPLLQHAEAIARNSPDMKELRRDIYREFSDLYADLHRYDLALQYRTKYEELRDSIFDAAKLKVISEMQTKYETAKKEKDILRLQEEKNQKDIRIARDENRQLYLYGGLAVLGIVVLFALFAFFSQRSNSRSLSEKNAQISRQNSTLKELNKKLIESEEELTKLNATKDQLFSVISHDLSGPVKAIGNFSTAIAGSEASMSKEELSASVAKLGNAIFPVQSLLDNLLHWSLLQRNAGEPRFTEFNAPELLHEVKSIFSAALETKKINVEISADAQLLIRSDRNICSLIVRNLLGNAIKFSPAGSRIVLAARRVNEKMVFSCRDSGPGISAERITAILAGKNVQPEKGTSAESGTGLGLKLVQEYLRVLGGKLLIVSDGKNGATFEAEIPVL